MAKPEWGQKQTCQNCAARFYDLGRTPVVCPKCGEAQVAQPAKARRPRAGETVPARAPSPAAATADDGATAENAPENGDEDDKDDDVIEDTSDLGKDDDDISEVVGSDAKET